MSKIFIQIASYRDPQLIPTIEDAINNALHPENLVFSIARQYHDDDGFDDLSQYSEDLRFRILNIPYNESKGVCWARNLTQQMYDDEEYTLQIDSHMRFRKNWDYYLINMVKNLQKKGHKKPLLTGYVSSFNPENDPQERIQEPWRMVFDRFIPEGAIFFLPETIPYWKGLKSPVPARFYSAHFCFTLGQFAKEVPHDPQFYFHGEEISIAVRAYTHGYDLFHPHILTLWHEYTRKGRTKQWDDDKEWGEKNRLAHLKNRKLFSMDGEVYNPEEFGIYGFGTERTLRDYEKYAGINFKDRSVQKHTLDKKYPPNPYTYNTEEEWLASFSKIFKHCIDISFESLPETDYDFIVVAFHNDAGDTLHRQDINGDDVLNLKSDPDGYCKIWREFLTPETPTNWVVWPHSVSKGWCDKIAGNL